MNDAPEARNNHSAGHLPPADFLTRGMMGWYGRLAAHRRALTVLLAALGVAFYLSSTQIHWGANAILYFSSHSKTVRDLQASEKQPGLGNNLRLDVHFAPGRTGDLAVAVRRLRRACERTGQFEWVWTGVSAKEQIRAAVYLTRPGPALLHTAQISQIRKRLSAAWLARHFRHVAARLEDPDGQLLATELQHDPLALHRLYFTHVQALHPLPGAHLADGLLLSADGKHAMMVLAPRVSPQNVAASRTMLKKLRAALARVQKTMPALRVWLIGSALNYASNQRRVLHDVVIISLVGTLLVAAAILLFFRRWVSVPICLIPPTIGVGTAMGIAGLLRLDLPLIVLGFNGLICGSTTDYGIQLIAAVNRRIRRGEELRIETLAAATREMFGPISMSVCTSVTGYSALALSSAPGLRELGLFVAGATICIWLATFLVLPAYLGPWIVRQQSSSYTAATTMRPGRRLKIVGSAAFLASTALLTWHAARVQYSYHGAALDGSSRRLLHREKLFLKTWGDLRQRAIVVVHDASARQALVRLNALSRTLRRFKREHLIQGYQTPAGILPDHDAIRRRRNAWRLFWTPARRALAQRHIAQAAEGAGFDPAAFAGAVAALTRLAPVPPARLRLANSPAALLPGSILLSSRGVTLAVIVRPNRSLSPRMQARWAGKLRLDHPHAAIISGALLFYNTTRRAAAEMKRLFPWVAILILVPMWMYFRRIDLALIAALSLGVGFLWLLGAAQWFAGGLNLLSLVPMLFTMGVAVDYGIYAASDPAQRRAPDERENRNPATFLCAATTILGTGAMLLAGHPVLHWIGLTLTAGITGGYLASLFLVGPLTRRLFRSNRPEVHKF